MSVKPSHSDCDKQFEHINDEAAKAGEEGNPVLSIDTKKEEHR
jgi:hypothetical protein